MLGAVRLAVDRATGGRQIPWDNSSLEAAFYFRPTAMRAANGGPVSSQTFATAATYGLLLPEDLKTQSYFSPGPGEAATFVGSWSSGNERWNGAGRQVMLVVLSADGDAGRAEVVFSQGPPGPRSINQNPANFVRRIAVLKDNTLQFRAFKGWIYKFRRVSDQELEGTFLSPPTSSPPNLTGLIRLYRID